MDDALGRGLVEGTGGGLGQLGGLGGVAGVGGLAEATDEVFSADLVALLRCRAFSLVLIRLSWDLMFATRGPLDLCGRVLGWVESDRVAPRPAGATAQVPASVGVANLGSRIRAGPMK